MQKPRQLAKIVITTAAAASLLVFPGARAAWGFMTSACGTIENSFTVSDCRVSVAEDFILPEKIEPGSKITKQVSVHNDGSSACFVRALVCFGDGNCGNWAKIRFNDTNWEVGEDGYRYYAGILEPGETSEPVCTEVEISSDANQAQLQDFDVIALCESVPVKDGSGTRHPNAKQAFARKGDLQ